jgi:Domain of unknown function (DUF2017)
MRLFERREDDVVWAQFDEFEAGVVGGLATQVAQLVDERPDYDAAVQRLLPDAYRDDPDSQDDYRAMTEADLASRKVANARLVASALAPGEWPRVVELDEGAAVRWMRSLTDIRLVLASRIGIRDDGETQMDTSETGLALREAYDVLGALQESLVRAVDA